MLRMGAEGENMKLGSFKVNEFEVDVELDERLVNWMLAKISSDITFNLAGKNLPDFMHTSGNGIYMEKNGNKLDITIFNID